VNFSSIDAFKQLTEKTYINQFLIFNVYEKVKANA